MYLKKKTGCRRSDNMTVKQLVNQIIVSDEGIEIQLKCGATVEKEQAVARIKPSAVDKTIIEGFLRSKSNESITL